MPTLAETQPLREELPREPQPERNCPFYGHHLVPAQYPGFLLVGSGGNQCAIVTNAFSPCMMEREGWHVNWQSCKRVSEIRFSMPKLGMLELPGDDFEGDGTS